MEIGYETKEIKVGAGQPFQLLAKGKGYNIFQFLNMRHSDYEVFVNNISLGKFPARIQPRLKAEIETIRILNKSDQVLTGEIALSGFEFTDTRSEMMGQTLDVVGTVNVKGAGLSSASKEFMVSGSIVKIADANIKRTSAFIKTSIDLFVFNNSTGTSGTVPTVDAGGSMTIGHTGEIWAITSGATGDVLFYEEEGA